MDTKPVTVVCAIIVHDNKILAVQRGPNMSLPLKWEFPGGKLEPNETEHDCIKREIKEELNIEIEVKNRLTPSYFEYPNIIIELIPYLAQYLSGEILLTEHNGYQFLSTSELNNLDWAEADLPILKELQSL
jgi:8-oxo-dGTP diphosphatase